MALLDSLRRKKERAQAPNAVLPEASNMVQLLDKSGATVYVTKEEWRTRFLPGMLSANRADPEQLSAIIVGSINDGFFADVLDAAEHLYQIDTVPARGACVYGIALMKNERLEDAERILLSHIEKYGEDGAVLTNLAKIYSAENETDRANATLWHALEIDPNQENALSWYAALGHEGAGKKGMVDAWQRVAALPGSWRAQLWLARTALEWHDPQRALARYRESLSRFGDNVPADFLMQMSGDLCKHGLMAEAIQLCEPLFAPEAHGLAVGNNLIKANLILGRIDSARRILNQLRIQQRPDWQTSLDFWETEIARSSGA